MAEFRALHSQNSSCQFPVFYSVVLVAGDKYYSHAFSTEFRILLMLI